jgi:hypothetical protein
MVKRLPDCRKGSEKYVTEESKIKLRCTQMIVICQRTHNIIFCQHTRVSSDNPQLAHRAEKGAQSEYDHKYDGSQNAHICKRQT